jgi:hypothetical protein
MNTDLFDINSQRISVPKVFSGPTRTLVVGIKFAESDEAFAIFPKAVTLQIEVQEIYNGECGPSILPPDYPLVLGCHKQHSTISSSYAIIPGTLPTDDKLDKWGRQFMCLTYSLFPQDLESLLDVFLLRFCSVTGDLPMVSPEPCIAF